MNKFKVFRIHKNDDGIQGSIEESTVDELSAGDVVIKVAYSSVNYKDALAATGAGKIIRDFPLIGGIDAAGHVVSSEDDRFKEGDAVLVTGFEYGTGHDGGYAEYTRVPADWVVRIPEGMTPKQVMELGTAGFTVAQCVQSLEDNHQKPDAGPFIVTGASGGVGSLAIDILSKLGYEVVALSGKVEEEQKLLSLGASRVMNRHELDLSGPPLEKSVWAGAIDNVGGDILAWLTRTVMPFGNIASVGLAGGAHLNTTVMPFILRGVNLLGIASAGCPTELRHHLWQRLATDLTPRHLDKIVTQEYSMEDLPEIFESLLAGTFSGRALIKIGS